jgi:hypothetical protein
MFTLQIGTCFGRFHVNWWGEANLSLNHLVLLTSHHLTAYGGTRLTLLCALAHTLPELAGRIRAAVATVALAVVTCVVWTWIQTVCHMHRRFVEQPSQDVCNMLSVSHKHLFIPSTEEVTSHSYDSSSWAVLYCNDLNFICSVCTNWGCHL